MHIYPNERSHPRMDIFAITLLATVSGTVMSTYIIRYMDKKAKKITVKPGSDTVIFINY